MPTFLSSFCGKWFLSNWTGEHKSQREKCCQCTSSQWCLVSHKINWSFLRLCSVSDSRSAGCVFKSRQGQFLFTFSLWGIQKKRCVYYFLTRMWNLVHKPTVSVTLAHVRSSRDAVWTVSKKKERKKNRVRERKKLKLTEHSADAHDGLEDGVGEAGSEPQGNAVGQTQPQGLVLGHEEKLGVGVDAIFLQGPGRPQQPALLLLPPQRVVRPIALDFCRGQRRNRCHCNVKHSQHRSASSTESKTENSLSTCRLVFHRNNSTVALKPLEV